VHHAGLDKTLLDRMCVRRFGHRLPAPVVDTLALEHRRNKRNHHLETNASLRLSDLRDEYGLPRYAAHDCLVDAIATAELLLAIVARRRSTALGDLLT
jgi:DNA polymerase-3 subunit epsilon